MHNRCIQNDCCITLSQFAAVITATKVSGIAVVIAADAVLTNKESCHCYIL